MNAPTNTAHLVESKFELLPRDAIAPSETEIQKMRRAKYDTGALEELANSIRADGVLMPIVVRPLPANDARGAFLKYEIVAGERRYIAAGKAGQEHILARILPLTDTQVLKAQIVENIQREGLDVMAEAQGFRELLDQSVPADAIGDMIGKSRSYVYARVKLLELSEPVKEKLKTGDIDPSQALLYARVPLKLQEKALKFVEQRSHGKELSFRAVADMVNNDKLFLSLAKVPFSTEDVHYFEFKPSGKRGLEDAVALPACTVCPKRSGNDPELLAALEDPNVCTDRLCHDAKAKAEFRRRRERAEREGRVVLTGDEAAAVIPSQYGNRGGMLDLDEECHEDTLQEPEPKGADGKRLKYGDPAWDAWDQRCEDYKQRSYRQILGDDVAALTLTLAEDPKTKRIVELAPDKEVAKVLKEKHGIKVTIYRDSKFEQRDAPPPAKPKDPEAARRQAEKEAREQAAAALEENIENATRLRLVQTMHSKWKGPLSRDDLELVVEFFLEEAGWSDSMEVLYAKRVTPATMNERDLGKLLVSWAVCSYADGYRNNDRPLKAVCKRLKIDEKAIEKAVRAELTPKAEGEPKKTAKTKGKKKK